MIKKFLLILLFLSLCNINLAYADDENQETANNEPQNLSLSSETAEPNNNENTPEVVEKVELVQKNEKVGEYYSEYPTVMFTPKNIDDIHKALNTKKQTTVMNFMQQEYNKGGNLIQENNQTIDENNITIFLNSILYTSPNDWVVWVNGNKITNKTNGDGEISIIKISPKKVDFTWLLDLTRWELINSNKKIPESQYKINNNNVNLYFTLSPNQTYIPTTNKTVEGVIKVESQNAENAEQSGDGYDGSGKVTDAQLESHDELFF